MPSKTNEPRRVRKVSSKLSQSEKKTFINQTTNTKKEIDRRNLIANAAYYRAEKRGFKGNEADAVQDWLEAEMEVDNALEAFKVDERDFQVSRDPNKE